MSEIRDIMVTEPKLHDPVALVGFPTVGVVGSILAVHMAKSMKLPVVGGFTSQDLPPYSFIHDGMVCPQIRILAGTPAVRKRKKGEEASPKIAKKDRRDIVIVTTEIGPKPEISYDLSVHIVKALKSLGVQELICIEGVGGVKIDGPMVCVPGSENAKARAKGAGLEIMKDGIVRGISGCIMLEASLNGMDPMSLLVPASLQVPDPRAAARLLEPISALYPSASVDPSTLLKEADEIERSIKAQPGPQNQNNIYG